MKKLLAVLMLAAAVVGTSGLVGCSGHEHSSDPHRETVGGAYTCPRHGGSYATANDHCKTCGNHVEKK